MTAPSVSRIRRSILCRIEPPFAAGRIAPPWRIPVFIMLIGPTMVAATCGGAEPLVGDLLGRPDATVVAGSPGPYAHDFPPTAARRVILRLLAPSEGGGVRITELALLGQEGSPARAYAFKESPAKSIEVLAALENTPLELAMPADEAAMLADGADGTFDQVSFAEAVLIASGVTDAADRAAQVAAIDRLVATAAESLAARPDLPAKGDTLLRLLHAGPMKGGYEKHQTDVSKILETGRFNCVSSAALYNVVGRRLGLDLRGIEVPEHAFSILYDGPRHVDVETTIPEGFNPARNPEAAAKLNARTGFAYVPESHRDERREVTDAGLVALIYYNHGVTSAEQGDHPTALAMCFRGLQLDPDSAPLVKNTLASLTNWTKALLDAGRTAEAVAVSKAALTLAPDDYDIRTNAKASFGTRAIEQFDAGQAAAALATLADGLAAFPHDHDLGEAKAGLFQRPAREHVERQEWQAALDAVSPGLALLEGRDRERLAEWCGAIRSQWANAEIDAGRFAAAREILMTGVKQNPDDGRLGDNLEYCIQESLAAVTEPDTEATAIADAVGLARELPRTSDVPEVITRHLGRRIMDLQRQGRWADAEDYARRHAAAIAPLGAPRVTDELWEWVYVPWVQGANEDWDAAIERYVRARVATDTSTLIRNNLEYSLDMRARRGFDRDWPGAVKAYEAALEVLPGSSLLENNLRYARQQAASPPRQPPPPRSRGQERWGRSLRAGPLRRARRAGSFHTVLPFNETTSATAG